MLQRELAFPLVDSSQSPAPCDTLVVIGGGTLIDRAKLWRSRAQPDRRLIAVPALWGSGAEVSPVAVETVGGRKLAAMGEHLLPDDYSVWPALAEVVPPDAARDGYGDVWAHALEAMFSPLANDALRQEIAVFITTRLLPAPFEPSPAWFDLSADACALQARASVGLVHGIAHELEPVLASEGAGRWGHARLCSVLLWPVMRFNAASSARIRELIGRFGLPWQQVLDKVRNLYDEDRFGRIMPLLETHWMSILRNPLTRTNGALVRPDMLAFFRERAFGAPDEPVA